MDGECGGREMNLSPARLYKDSLAFRLLRMHGHSVSPCMNLDFSFLNLILKDIDG